MRASGALALDVAGTRLWLRPDRTVWWPDEGVLFAADLHLGKGAAFRAMGQPLPAGGSSATLQRLASAARACGAARVVVLGDFWHHRSGLGPALEAGVAEFATRWPTTVILGNHDRTVAPEAAARLPLQVERGRLAVGPFTAAHEPALASAAAPRAGFTLAGHLHPAVLLRSRSGDRLRQPCFAITAHELVLPAFGSHTGSWTCTPAEYERLDARVALAGASEVVLLGRSTGARAHGRPRQT
ncbi:MAG: ligase-associated DNA damage response endonuclease PdeM [Burkholderiales bacterium]|nr:ligase-associated DNA damage response endonuclease PdeM [Burkholderiales bacterium]